MLMAGGERGQNARETRTLASWAVVRDGDVCVCRARPRDLGAAAATELETHAVVGACRLLVLDLSQVRVMAPGVVAVLAGMVAGRAVRVLGAGPEVAATLATAGLGALVVPGEATR